MNAFLEMNCPKDHCLAEAKARMAALKVNRIR